MEQDSFRRFYPKALEEFRMLERELDHLPYLLDLFFQTTYVLVSDL